MIGLDKDEHIIFQIRKHWFVFAVEVMTLIFLALIPLIVLSVINSVSVQVELNGSFAAFIIFIYTWWILLLWITGFIFWTDYFLDVWIVTNKKLLDIEQRGLFNREVSILHLDKIQDVTSEVNGITATFIDYGDIHVQTAGQQREFIIRAIPRPDEVRQRLNDALMRHKELNQDINKDTGNVSQK